MTEAFKRFVSVTAGVDAPGNGRTKSDTPLRTIAAALRQLVRARAGNSKKRITINLDTGTYAETVTLVSNMTLQTGVRKINLGSTPDARLTRPQAPSRQGENSTRSPTTDHILTIRGNRIRVHGIIIDGEKGPQRGILIDRSKNVRIRGCLIQNCHSRVWHPVSPGTKQKPFPTPPSRRGTGAGMSIRRSVDIRIEASVFDDNRTEAKFRQTLFRHEITKLKSTILGRAAAFKHSNKILEPIRLRNGGGHISVIHSSKVRMTDSFFVNGFCGGRGGAIQLGEKGYARIVGCVFRDNEAAIDGGAIAINDPSVIDFTRQTVKVFSCVFEDNKAGDDGGAVYLTSAALLGLKNCKFERNEAVGNGGALRLTFGSTCKVLKCEFHNNKANTDGNALDGGGAIASGNATLMLIRCKVNDNKCQGFAGAGIYFITRKYDAEAEFATELIGGHTFETLLKKRYGVSSVELTLFKTDLLANDATGKTSHGGKTKARGAGAAIYALESLGNFGIPVEGLDLTLRNPG